MPEGTHEDQEDTQSCPKTIEQIFFFSLIGLTEKSRPWRIQMRSAIDSNVGQEIKRAACAIISLQQTVEANSPTWHCHSKG